MISEQTKEYMPTEPWRVHPPQGFYDEEWIEDQQAEDDYQKISNIVFLNGVQEVPLVQHQGGECSIYNVRRHVRYSVEDMNLHLPES